jgi:hypothetical protein
VDGAGWLNALATTGRPDDAPMARLGEVLARLLDFAAMKGAISPDDERLVEALAAPTATQASGESLLLTVTGWNERSLDDLLGRFGLTRAQLRGIAAFRRIFDAYQLVRASGIPAAALARAACNNPTAETVAALQAALRARYDEADWLAALRPINDELRALRRDALVTHVLQSMAEDAATSHIDTPDKLFEHFLMDVQMEPCMETSRIRHALSSVQLFVERCLMNLEPSVAPTSIRADQWEWMKRYRVWEANRKVFLWPENWLEPELRDDQSSLFRETMSELLQSDITEDAAAAALGGYLARLAEIAKLQPCGIYCVERDPGVEDDIIHVVARTAGATRAYYHRQRAGGSWTPWEPIKLDIEDDPVLPVVWKGRLFLFWLRILTESPMDGPAAAPQDASTNSLAQLNMSDVKQHVRADAKAAAKVTVKGILCWSEFYNGKWQAPKTSDPNRPTVLGTMFEAMGEYAFDRSAVTLGAYPYDDALAILIDMDNTEGFLLYNTHSQPERVDGTYLSVDTLKLYNAQVNPWVRERVLRVAYTVEGPQSGKVRKVLSGSLNGRVVRPEQPLTSVWTAPFLFEDARHVFYVTTSTRAVEIVEGIIWEGPYGIDPGIKEPDYTIPDMIYEIPIKPVIPDLLGPIVQGPDYGVIDPVRVQRFVTTDAYIHTGIGAAAGFAFDGLVLGPNGTIAGLPGGR